MGKRRRKRKCKGVCYGKGGQEEELQGVIYCLRTEWKSKQRPEMEERKGNRQKERVQRQECDGKRGNFARIFFRCFEYRH